MITVNSSRARARLGKCVPVTAVGGVPGYGGIGAELRRRARSTCRGPGRRRRVGAAPRAGSVVVFGQFGERGQRCLQDLEVPLDPRPPPCLSVVQDLS